MGNKLSHIILGKDYPLKLFEKFSGLSWKTPKTFL